jgi:NAD(P)-dependent dehydrogenase (short-subunit alcohol dehydrogenase family)
MSTLDGKVAIVTGAGRGLGRCHALALAAEGAQVVVNDLGGEWDGQGSDNRPAQQVVEEIEAMGGKAVASYDSVSSFEGARKLIDLAVQSFGGLNILVNNAGILRDKMTFNMTESDWDSVIDVHLKGHFAPTHFAVNHWRTLSKAGEPVYGRIINTASESGLFGNAGQLNYAAAKAGIAAMTVVLARELTKMGVTANCLAPRARTRLTEMTFSGFGVDESSGFDVLAPENVSPLVAWLAGPDAADVTGQVFVVWGDEVAVTQGWTQVGIAKNDGKMFTVAELQAQKDTLFATRSPGVPEFGIPVADHLK